MSRRCTSADDVNPHNCDNPLWEVHGIKGDGPMPKIVGQYQGRKLWILAGGSNVWEDIHCTGQYQGADVMCINKICMDFKGTVHHVAGAHPEWFEGFLHERCHPSHQDLNRPLFHSDYTTNESTSKYLAPKQDLTNIVDYCWSGLGNQVASSGMLGILIAVCMGYEKIILCGMPLDFITYNHYYDPPWHKIPIDNMTQVIIKASLNYCQESLPEVMKRVRSFSGQTLLTFGAPSLEWWNDV